MSRAVVLDTTGDAVPARGRKPALAGAESSDKNKGIDDLITVSTFRKWCVLLSLDMQQQATGNKYYQITSLGRLSVCSSELSVDLGRIFTPSAVDILSRVSFTVSSRTQRRSRSRKALWKITTAKRTVVVVACACGKRRSLLLCYIALPRAVRRASGELVRDFVTERSEKDGSAGAKTRITF